MHSTPLHSFFECFPFFCFWVKFLRSHCISWSGKWTFCPPLLFFLSFIHVWLTFHWQHSLSYNRPQRPHLPLLCEMRFFFFPAEPPLFRLLFIYPLELVWHFLWRRSQMCGREMKPCLHIRFYLLSITSYYTRDFHHTCSLHFCALKQL